MIYLIKEFHDRNLYKKYNLDDFIPVRLDEAIKARGLSRKEAADKLEITVSELGRVLMQGKGVTDELMLKASDALNFPVGFFFKPLPQPSKYASSITFYD